GALVVERAGFALRDGLIERDVIRAALREAVANVLESCASPAPPASCDLIGGLLPANDPDAGVELIVQLLGGFDARLQAGRPAACEGNACDLLSVCIAAEMSPTQVR
ncbi:MAG: hypothetical protein KC583_16315, partial [Myxococcales bacterium]|nr:hypothetical protein [Myxococcales bacterium]